VIRFLDREAEITTRYGGGFVQSIDGVAGDYRDGRSLDWFFYVDGIESPVGSAERQVRAGHRIWWDYHDWTDVIRVPAVVGSWPEPFLQAATEGGPRLVRVECHGERAPCATAAERLSEQGVEASVESSPQADDREQAPRLLVGPWDELRDDPAAALIEDGPTASGVFARFEPEAGGYRLVALDQRAEPVAELGPGAGLVAAVREGEGPVTWLLTGTDEEGVEEALALLDTEHLADRYAVAAGAGEELALPAAEPEAEAAP
jgi:hypothetical protein